MYWGTAFFLSPPLLFYFFLHAFQAGWWDDFLTTFALALIGPVNFVFIRGVSKSCYEVMTALSSIRVSLDMNLSLSVVVVNAATMNST